MLKQTFFWEVVGFVFANKNANQVAQAGWVWIQKNTTARKTTKFTQKF